MRPGAALVEFCTTLIGEVNNLVADVHDRMPVILEAGDFEQWEHSEAKGRERADEARRGRAANVAGVGEVNSLGRMGMMQP